MFTIEAAFPKTKELETVQQCSTDNDFMNNTVKNNNFICVLNVNFTAKTNKSQWFDTFSDTEMHYRIGTL